MDSKDIKPTSVRIPAELMKELKKIADQERRSVSNQILIAIDEHIEKHKSK